MKTLKALLATLVIGSSAFAADQDTAQQALIAQAVRDYQNIRPPVGGTIEGEIVFRAIENDNIALVEALINQGHVDLDTTRSYRCNFLPLSFAAVLGKMDMCQLLLSLGANPLSKVPGNRYTAFDYLEDAHAEGLTDATYTEIKGMFEYASEDPTKSAAKHF